VSLAGPPIDDPAAHFEEMHRRDGDPWGFRTSWYERRKYAITMAALPRARYERVWEPAASIGELTRLLSERADRVDASDVSPTAVAAAREANAGRPGVRVAEVRLPAAPPVTGYDLIVLSEILYYLPDPDREQVLVTAAEVAAPEADLVVVHWRHNPEDAWAAGADVNAAVRERPGWSPLVRHDEPDFVLDVLRRS
jgi:SAM-dependent methyltransferase